MGEWATVSVRGWVRVWVGLVVVLVVVLVSGCKVSTSDDHHSGHGTDGFSHGHFEDARDTGHYFPTAGWSLDHYTEVCVGETLYFETANRRVRVYGSPAYSEITFRAAATELDHRIDGVLNQFRMNWSDFVAERSAAAPYPKQILACLSPRVSDAQFSAASLSAVAIAPYYESWPYDAGRIVTHDLAHFVQENMSRYNASESLLPLWFAEGQAAVVAGEPIAPVYQHYEYDPLWDVAQYDAGSASYRYEHYALAYSYLEKANGALAMTLLLDLVQFMDWDGEYGVTSTGESWAFVKAFNAAELVDHQDRYLSFERFKVEYHALLSDS